MKILNTVEEARHYLQCGSVIAYPTEAMYGLGCDPFNQQAVETILTLKHRQRRQGMILLIANWEQLFPLIDHIPEAALAAVRASWPGPVTWLFPKSLLIPEWISGEHNSVAIRMSAHPLVQQLCAHHPIVSTSANISGQEPARDITGLRNQFMENVDAVLQGNLGTETKPSSIYDVLSGKQLR